jgi:fused signal recognition particle receptor
MTEREIVVYALASVGLFIVLWALLTGRVGGRSQGRKRPSEAGTSAPSPSSSPSQAPETPAPTLWNLALSKTRHLFGLQPTQDVRALRESLEEACLVSDLGVSNTHEALDSLDWTRIEALAPAERPSSVREELKTRLRPWVSSSGNDQGAWPAPRAGEPLVIWFVGVNGVGKTTSIAKLASELKGRGHSVMLAAGDTFRAAASEQLETWAQRLEIPCVRGQAGADSSAVLFDAIQSAKSKNIGFVLCDSAGRLHNQGQLMDALKKNKRVMDKALAGAPHEVLLVLDANTGQNMLHQAEAFLRDVGVTGLILTKLDGTARGGAVVAVARKTGLPIRRLGLGETPADFRAFDPDGFVEGLIG